MNNFKKVEFNFNKVNRGGRKGNYITIYDRILYLNSNAYNYLLKPKKISILYSERDDIIAIKRDEENGEFKVSNKTSISSIALIEYFKSHFGNKKRIHFKMEDGMILFL